MKNLHHIFVYGTLKRGQCRESCWPSVPLSVVPAWTMGRLYDLGEYPAMIPGDMAVAGQVWSYDARAIETVRVVLDRIEVTNQPRTANEYDRVEIEVNTLDGQLLIAETYLFSRPDQLVQSGLLLDAELVYQNKRLAVWPRNCQWP